MQLIEKVLGVELNNLSAYNVGLLQGKAYNRLQVKLTKTLAIYNVSIPEWKLLGQVYEQENTKLSTLAELLSYDPPMVTKLVKQLEKKKLVIRQLDKNDERAKIVSITKEGAKIVKSAEPAVRSAMRDILKGASLNELKSYLKVLSIILKNS